MYKLETGINRKGVWIKDYEMEMLYLLYNQGLLTSKQLYSFVENIQGIHYNSFLKRLVRFAKAGLIVEHKYSLGQKGFYYKYYRIGTKGVQVLVDTEKISGKIKGNISRLSRMKNINHYLATQEIVLHSLVEAFKNNLSLYSLNPFDYPYLDETTEDHLIIPDWIVKNGEIVLNVELDTGSETNTVLVEKIRKYIQVAKNNPEQKHNVFIAVLDESYRSRFSYGQRMKRVGNLKQSIATLNIEVSNLEVFVVPFYRAKELFTNILFGRVPFGKNIRKVEAEIAVYSLDMLESFPYTLDKLDIQDYSNSINNRLQVDGIYKVKRKDIGTPKIMAVIIMEEGDVASIRKLRYHHQLLVDNKLNKPIDKILVIYPFTEAFEHDVLGSNYSQCLIGVTEMWSKELDGEPTFYLQKYPYRREEYAFEL